MTALLFLPAAFAASLYAVGSLGVKRCLENGATSRRAIFVTNGFMALWALPLLFFLEPSEFELTAWLTAVAAGVALFAGRILAVKALEVGDLSIVGPLLGIKTLLVAVFSVLTGQTELNLWIWASVLLASVGVIALQRGPRKRARNRLVAGAFAAGASVLFAGCDILVVEAREHLGVGWLSPTLFITVALLGPLLGHIAKPPKEAVRPLYAGAMIMGFQTTLVVFMIGLTGEAVVINIVYCTRAIWTVVVDRVAGRSEGVAEFFLPRMAGAFCLVGAVGIAIVSR